MSPPKLFSQSSTDKHTCRSNAREGCCPKSVAGGVKEQASSQAIHFFWHVLDLQFPFCHDLKRHLNHVCWAKK